MKEKGRSQGSFARLWFESFASPFGLLGFN